MHEVDAAKTTDTKSTGTSTVFFVKPALLCCSHNRPNYFKNNTFPCWVKSCPPLKGGLPYYFAEHHPFVNQVTDDMNMQGFH